MKERKTYYVSPKGDIFPIKTDQSLQLFEIEATENELNQFKVAVEEFNASEDIEKEDFWTLAHFKEKEVDEDRNVTYGKILEVYKWIYTLGTSKTKLEIERMNILPSLDQKPSFK
ncbi:hypothetical protein [Alkalihalobacillus sp. TS-13]|uniref:hypothetical protein n=1 Tax=Alkalihalobacillus sp. TS-13 TaxID=2842455 RepID=UPI001C86CCDA|nr:hypothetical protein [Alkalihalobacillus sp. TS-13]